MTAATNEADLATLRRQAETRQRQYLETLGEIKAQRAQLDEALAALDELGCGSVAEAENLAETLQTRIDDQLAEIRRLLG